MSGASPFTVFGHFGVPRPPRARHRNASRTSNARADGLGVRVLPALGFGGGE